ncbi:RNA-processing protein PTA1 [Lachancea thermotolerans CBS 6340]|uniref:KLTH0D01078p n=1 Tax=Lachancea thermotolerans (strain ATCC 56472 / CBS 6340 / NRRL Y-8284) TaxID=559295 RepID=C5DFZ1_LACTC|nr:KLTH0D01078p [Lachancea thermotolerans CBS 6340]CAR22333.1 KLTH0D01078p [Lachancea thermotolerans CBS 6340]
MSSEVLQLAQARELAMDNKPGEMLPKVLDTAMALHRSSRSPSVELGRLCAKLFLDVASHEAVVSSEKPFLASQHLGELWKLCSSSTDHSTLRDGILGLSRCYDWLFDLVAKTSNKELWETLCQFRSFVLSKWKTVYPLTPSEDSLQDHSRSLGVKLATVKFISTLVIVHTPGNSGISIASVPENHPVITGKSQLESGAKKLLGFLLSYLSEEPMMVASLFIGVLNCLAFVMKRRPQATYHILGGLLRFNVDMKYQQNAESVLQYRLAKRFVERCYKVFVQFGLKSQLIKNSGNMAQYHAKLSKISQTLHIIGEETKAKGIMNFDPKQVERKMPSRERAKYVTALKASNQNSSSRNNSTQPRMSPDMQLLTELQKYTMSKNSSAGFFNTSPIAFDSTYASVYSLMNSKHSEIDVSKLSPAVMAKLCTECLYQTDTNKMISGLSIVASRYTDLMNKASQATDNKKRPLEADTVQQPSKKREVVKQPEDEELSEDEDKQEFTLGAPAPMSEEEKKQHFIRIVGHIMAVKDSEEEPGASNEVPVNMLHKVRLLDWNNKTSWLTLLTRLASRGVSHNEEMSNTARQAIYDYFIEDFGNRVAVVIEWLSEEWYYESLNNEKGETPVYDQWSLKILDALIPFLEVSHRRLFIRLVSELPRLSQEHVDKIRSLCLDPLRGSLGFQSLKFMVMFRPPVKPHIAKLLTSMKEQDESVREQCEAVLAKFY